MSTVIKHNAVSTRPVRPRTFELKDHVAQATALVEAARLRSQRMIQQAQIHAEETRQQAAREGYISGHKKGFEEGKRSGHAQAMAEASATFQKDQEHLALSLRQILDDVDARKRDLLIHAKADVLELALTIADRITRRIGVLDPQVVVENVAAACKLTAAMTDLVIHIHPRDSDTLRQFSRRWISPPRDWNHVTLVEDASIQRGGCMVSTSDQFIDARLETQIAEIAALLIRDPVTPRPTELDAPPELTLEPSAEGDQ